MAKKRAKKAKSPMTITVRRVGETGAAPAVSGKKRGGYRGPSKAMTRMTGAVSSARKAAARAGQVAKAEPTRVAVGTIAGSVVGKIGADMIHDNAAKSPTGTCGKHEATCNAVAGGAAVALGIGVALMGPQTVTKRYAVQTLSHVASFMAGSANAISNAEKKPVAKPATAGSEDDPFRYSSPGDTGARGERVMRRRQMIASRMAERMRAEDPQGAGTEGPELEGYCDELLGEVMDEISAVEGALASDEVGVIPVSILAALANPQTAQAVKTLMTLATEKGKKALEDLRADQPVTQAVLELEGAAPEEIETGARSAKAKELRRERRELRRDVRTKKRAERKAKRTERRKARQERKEAKLESKVETLRERRDAQRPAARRPVIIRTVPAQPAPEPEAEDDEPLVIVIPTDEEVLEYGE